MANKYVGLDVHKETTSFCVLGEDGSQLLEGVVQTRQEALQDLVGGLPGDVHVALEEGTQATWLYDLLEPVCRRVVVCDPRTLGRPRGADKSDREDARDLAERLFAGKLRPVYKGGEGMRDLRSLVMAYDNVVSDAVRTKNRIKAVFRAHGIATKGQGPYRKEGREAWLDTLPRRGLRTRVSLLLVQLDAVTEVRELALRQVLQEARRFSVYKLLKGVPGVGQIRSAQIMAWMVTPHRFRTRRQLWNYAGLAVVRRTSADYRVEGGAIRRSERVTTRGLNRRHNPHLTYLFKAAAVDAINHKKLREVAVHHIERGLSAPLVRVTIARRIAAICLHIWKTGEPYDKTKAFPTIYGAPQAT